MTKFKYFNKGFVLWFTGLSGAGKTTIALLVLKKLKKGLYHYQIFGEKLSTILPAKFWWLLCIEFLV